ncbi:MAG: ATP-binding cassette domain-containing protein [Bacteroidota bacterium]|nr:ATP-binding cassette domain-containing protein [Bacteroidota bacterium]
MTNPDPQDVVVINNLHKAFGRRRILRGINLRVRCGESVAIMGGSGTGKSVLLKHIVGLIEPDLGAIQVLGQRIDELSSLDLDAVRLRIGYLFQGGALFDSMTVADNMDFVLRRHTDLRKAERTDRIMEALDWVSLQATANQYPAQLSGGQKKRVALARAIILEPEILLCDEPTTGLDPVSVRTVSNLLVRLQRRNMSVITITHDLLCAEITADRAVFLHEGKVLAQGALSNMRTHPHPMLKEFFH